MSSEMMDISSYWKNGHLDPAHAFQSSAEAVEYLARLAGDLPKKYGLSLSVVCDMLLTDRFQQVGEDVSVGATSGTVQALLPSGKYLILAEQSPKRRDRVYLRYGWETPVESMPEPGQKESAPQKKMIDITDYWRKDNELRRERVLIDEDDAVAYIRREAAESREEASAKYGEILAVIENTCLAIEHDYFQLIGRKVETNSRGSDASRGPLPVSGEVVAVLPEGQGLAVTSEINKMRHGFIIGRKRMAQIVRDSGKSKRRAERGKKIE